MPNVAMIAPAGRTGIIHASKSLQAYRIAADGSVSVDSQDVNDLLGAGFTLAPRVSTSANGLLATAFPLSNFKNADGTTLSASASSGKFGLSDTPGTSETLTGEAAQGNTKTDSAQYDYMLPANYVAGEDITVTVNAKYSGSGTAGATKTVDVQAYLKKDDGTDGTDICTTNAQALTASNTDRAFTLDGSTLRPGEVVTIVVATALQETGGSASLTAAVNSVRAS